MSSWSPYAFSFDNPVRYVDPDGRKPLDNIIVNNLGKVHYVDRNNQPNRFFDMKGNELKFNDSKGVDKQFVGSRFNKGDRVFYPISAGQVDKAVKSVGLNDEIKAERSLGSKSRTIIEASVHYGIASAMVGYESHNDADFTFSFLDQQVEPGTLTEVGTLRMQYVEDDAFFKFEGTNDVYNIYDAGNFMWGKWSKEIGLTNTEVKAGSQLNELGKDTKADQEAIQKGRMY